MTDVILQKQIYYHKGLLKEPCLCLIKKASKSLYIVQKGVSAPLSLETCNPITTVSTPITGKYQILW